MPLGETFYHYVGQADRPPMPADPLPGDLCVHRVADESVYSILPMTDDGRAFVLKHHDAGSVHGDMLLVPMRSIFPFMNSVFDEGLKVV